MSKQLLSAPPVLVWLAILAFGSPPTPSSAQIVGRQPLQFRLSGPVERLEMIANTSRILTTEHNIPRLLVENDSVVRAKPIAPNQVQLSALKPGFTNLTVWDDKDKEHTIDVLVYGDARELENLLMTEFPDATLRVRPLASSVIISGYVPRAEMVSRIVQMAEDYYPEVINNITVGGVQQILLHVKLMEVSRTKLRRMGFDWALSTSNVSIFQNVAGLIGEASITPGVPSVTSTGGETRGFRYRQRQHGLLRVPGCPAAVQPGKSAGGTDAGDSQRTTRQFQLGRRIPDHRAAEPRDGLDRVPPIRHPRRFRADRAGQRPRPTGSAPAGQRNRSRSERHDCQHHGSGNPHPVG